MALIKVIGNEKTSLKIISAQAEIAETLLRYCWEQSQNTKNRCTPQNYKYRCKINSENVISFLGEGTFLFLRSLSAFNAVLTLELTVFGDSDFLCFKTVLSIISVDSAISACAEKIFELVFSFPITYIIVVLCFYAVLSLISVVSAFAEMIIKLVVLFPITFIIVVLF